jgi:hypothetical protein
MVSHLTPPFAKGTKQDLTGPNPAAHTTWINHLLQPVPQEGDTRNAHLESLTQKVQGMEKNDFWKDSVSLTDDMVCHIISISLYFCHRVNLSSWRHFHQDGCV